MKRKRNIHIALILLLGFIYPIAFQPVHIYNHKRKLAEQHHNCSHHHHDKVTSSKRDKGFVINKSQQTQQECLICEYEFSVNDIAGLFIYKTTIPAVKYLYNDSVIAQILNCVLFPKHPRGPPYSDLLS